MIEAADGGARQKNCASAKRQTRVLWRSGRNHTKWLCAGLEAGRRRAGKRGGRLEQLGGRRDGERSARCRSLERELEQGRGRRPT